MRFFRQNKQAIYQEKLNRVCEVINRRAKEVNYDYSNNIEEMNYLFDLKIKYLEQRNKYREKAGQLAAKLKYKGVL